MKIEIRVNTGYVGCEKKDIIELDDDLTEEEIEESALERMFEMIGWSWRKVEDDDS
jgi:hypothetical protein